MIVDDEGNLKILTKTGKGMGLMQAQIAVGCLVAVLDHADSAFKRPLRHRNQLRGVNHIRCDRIQPVNRRLLRHLCRSRYRSRRAPRTGGPADAVPFPAEIRLSAIARYTPAL